VIGFNRIRRLPEWRTNYKPKNKGLKPMKTKLSFLLIPLVLACFALLPTNVCAGTITLRTGSVFSEDPTSIQLSAQGSQEHPDQPMIAIPMIIIFDPPGAAPPGTFTHDINPAGAIVGLYFDAMLMGHGFLRAPDGTITTFDVPGAGTGSGQGTLGENINDSEVIEGNYIDASNVAHGFVRARDGTITTFDAPGAGTGSGQGTFPNGHINDTGTITGYDVDNNNVRHGFLRSP